MDKISSIRKNSQASTTTVGVVQFLVMLALIVGIVMMYTYDQNDTGYTIGKVMAITAGVIIGLNILFMVIGLGLLGYTLYRVDKAQEAQGSQGSQDVKGIQMV